MAISETIDDKNDENKTSEEKKNKKKDKRKDKNAPLVRKSLLETSEAISKRQELLSSIKSPADRKRVSSHLPTPITDDDADDTVRDELNLQQRRARKQRHKYSQRNRQAIENIATKNVEHAILAANAELILETNSPGVIEPENALEKTYKLTQRQLKNNHLDEQTSRQIYNLDLPHYGPYNITYTRSGRHSLLSGLSGHISHMDCHTLSLTSELHLNEPTHDATFLHNDTLYALAQRRNVYIYDNRGTEIHRLSEHTNPLALGFLPYHWLLSSIGAQGYLKYHDTSTGTLVSTHRTKLGPCRILKPNPRTSVVHCGHDNGTVTLWSPAQKDYLAKMMCHPGCPVRDVAFDPSGRIMLTGGANGQVRIWDLRTYGETHRYVVGRGKGALKSLDVSQTGIWGVGHGSTCTFWSAASLTVKESRPYMTHRLVKSSHQVERLRFRPFEDVVGIGTSGGFESIVIPGSGEPNLDSLEYNLDPYQDKKQRKEAEVRSLLEKLPPDMIGLEDGRVGTVEEGEEARKARAEEREREANASKEERERRRKEKKKMRGRGTITKKVKKKQRVAKEEGLKLMKEKREMERKEKKEKRREEGKREAEPALKRFFN